MPLSRFQKILIVVGMLFVLGAGGAAYFLLRPGAGNQSNQRHPATSGAVTGSSSPQTLSRLPLSPTSTTPTGTAPVLQRPPAVPSETSTSGEVGAPPQRP